MKDSFCLKGFYPLHKISSFWRRQCNSASKIYSEDITQLFSCFMKQRDGRKEATLMVLFHFSQRVHWGNFLYHSAVPISLTSNTGYCVHPIALEYLICLLLWSITPSLTPWCDMMNVPAFLRGSRGFVQPSLQVLCILNPLRLCPQKSI